MIRAAGIDLTVPWHDLGASIGRNERGSGMSASADVDAYLAAQPEDRRRVMELLRRTIAEAAPDASEVISYKMPAAPHSPDREGRPSARRRARPPVRSVAMTPFASARSAGDLYRRETAA